MREFTAPVYAGKGVTLFRSTDPAMREHHFGGELTSEPARPFAEFTAEDKEKVPQFFASELDVFVREAGRLWS